MWLRIVAKHGKDSDQAKAPPGLMKAYGILESSAIDSGATRQGATPRSSSSRPTPPSQRRNPFPQLLVDSSSPAKPPPPSPTSDDEESSSIDPPWHATPVEAPIVAASPASEPIPVEASVVAASPASEPMEIEASPPRKIDVAEISEESPPRAVSPLGRWNTENNDEAQTVTIEVKANTVMKIMGDGAMVPAKKLEKGKGGFVIAHWSVGEPVETEVLNSQLRDGLIHSYRQPLRPPFPLNSSLLPRPHPPLLAPVPFPLSFLTISSLFLLRPTPANRLSLPLPSSENHVFVFRVGFAGCIPTRISKGTQPWPRRRFSILALGVRSDQNFEGYPAVATRAP